MQLTYFEYSIDDISNCANTAKEVTLRHLLKEGMITQEHYDDVDAHNAIVILDERPTYGSRIRKWFGYEKESMKKMHTYAMVRFLSETDES